MHLAGPTNTGAVHYMGHTGSQSERAMSINFALISCHYHAGDNAGQRGKPKLYYRVGCRD